MTQGKTCTKCGEWKLFEGFTKNKNRKDGFQAGCKECAKQYYQENKERYKEQGEQYRQENPERIKEQRKRYHQKYKERKNQHNKQYYQENKERIKERVKQYRQENLEQYKEYDKQYHQENIERIKERKKQHYQENAEQFKEYTKQWCQENPERLKGYQRQYGQTKKGKEAHYRANLKRRSYKQKVEFTPHQRKEILDRDKWQCQSCGIKVHDRSSGDWNTPDKAHIDHVIPISKGGNSEPSNLQTLCRTCNLSKQDKVELQLELF